MSTNAESRDWLTDWICAATEETLTEFVERVEAQERSDVDFGSLLQNAAQFQQAAQYVRQGLLPIGGLLGSLYPPSYWRRP